MYNGIGLQTPRGSGTNGYIQTNKFFVKHKTGNVAISSKGYEADQGTGGITKKPNKDILEHDRKRQIELKLVVLEDKLMEQGYSDAEIAQKLDEARTTLQAASDSQDTVSDAKVSDTQSHQIAARKEKQMETLRAALGIESSEHGGQDVEEVDDGIRIGRKTDDRNWSEKREHSFLDREFRQKKDVNEDLKVDKYDKKRRGKSVRDDEIEEGEIDDSKLYKEEHRKKRPRDESSDADSSDSEEGRSKKQAKGSQRKHHKVKRESESETDSDDRRKKRKAKKHKKSRRYESESSDYASETESESEKITSVKPKASKRHGVDRDYSSSDKDDIGRYNPKRKVEKYEKSLQRHDFDDHVKANSKQKGDKYEKSHHRHDSDHDDDVSGCEVEVSKHRSEVARLQSKTRRHDSDDDFDVDDRWKSDGRGGKSSKNRYRDEESDSDRGGRETRELTKTGRKRYDIDGNSDAGGDGKKARRGRHDSDDEGNGRQSGKKAGGKQEIHQKLDTVSYESLDDKSGSKSESESSDSHYKHRKIVQKNHADEKRGRSAQEREIRSGTVGSDVRRRVTNDDDHRKERSAVSNDRYQSRKDFEKFDNRDMRRSNIDDRRREDQRVPKSNNRSAGNEHHERDSRQDDKFEAHKDDEERDNYSKSGRNQVRDRNVEDDGRNSCREDEPRRESRGGRDYDHHRAETREGRRCQRDEEEDDKTAKPVREDADQLHGSRRRARLEEEDQGSKGCEGEYSKRTRYDDSRSSERRRYEDGKCSDDRSRYRD